MNLDRRQEMVSEREDQLITITREYESICIEFEQTNAANEQNGIKKFLFLITFETFRSYK